MKKILGILLGIFLLCQTAFAVDTLRVIRSGKLIKTSSPIVNELTTTTLNYDVTGNVSCNTLVVTTSATIPILTATTINAFILNGALTSNDKDITGADDLEGDKIAASETLAVSGSESKTASGSISVAYGLTIISQNQTEEQVFTLATPNVNGLIKTIFVKATASPNAIEITGLLGGKVTVNMDAINDSLLLQYQNPNWMILGGNSYSIE